MAGAQGKRRKAAAAAIDGGVLHVLARGTLRLTILRRMSQISHASLAMQVIANLASSSPVREGVEQAVCSRLGINRRPSRVTP
jgi:hypothetical protein